ncbi:hypothetical protein FHS42_006073 [Streptomyces zagrosensis]|uniref:Uncharacterized protein n=1 Tax=Streptomyces zagrosensis TaxID=1042984 RepID=A0A7W9QEU3_9ACTN|nr:hypothetical protein [Streptomyces zagrosensis]
MLVDGQNFHEFTFDITGKSRTNVGYAGRQVFFVARSASTTVTYVSTTPNSAYGPTIGPTIDDVVVKAACCSCGCHRSTDAKH